MCYLPSVFVTTAIVALCAAIIYKIWIHHQVGGITDFDSADESYEPNIANLIDRNTSLAAFENELFLKRSGNHNASETHLLRSIVLVYADSERSNSTLLDKTSIKEAIKHEVSELGKALHYEGLTEIQKDIQNPKFTSSKTVAKLFKTINESTTESLTFPFDTSPFGQLLKIIRPLDVHEIMNSHQHWYSFDAKALAAEVCLFVLGLSRHGKTTAVHHLCGTPMKSIYSKEIGDWIVLPAVAVKDDVKKFKIGHTTRSETKNINKVSISVNYKDEVKTMNIFDTGGLLDNRGSTIEITNAHGISAALEQCNSSKVYIAVVIKRDPQLLQTLFESLNRALPDLRKNMHSLSYIFSRGFEDIPDDPYESLIKFIESLKTQENMKPFYVYLNDMLDKVKRRDNVFILRFRSSNDGGPSKYQLPSGEFILQTVFSKPGITEANVFASANSLLSADTESTISAQVNFYEHRIQVLSHPLKFNFEIVNHDLNALQNMSNLEKFSKGYESSIGAISDNIINFLKAENKVLFTSLTIDEPWVSSATFNNDVIRYESALNMINRTAKSLTHHLPSIVSEVENELRVLRNKVNETTFQFLNTSLNGCDFYKSFTPFKMQARLQRLKFISENKNEFIDVYQSLAQVIQNNIMLCFENYNTSVLNSWNATVAADSLYLFLNYSQIINDDTLYNTSQNLFLRRYSDLSLNLTEMYNNKSVLDLNDWKLVQNSSNYFHSLRVEISEFYFDKYLQSKLKDAHVSFLKLNSKYLEISNKQLNESLIFRQDLSKVHDYFLQIRNYSVLESLTTYPEISGHVHSFMDQSKKNVEGFIVQLARNVSDSLSVLQTLNATEVTVKMLTDSLDLLAQIQWIRYYSSEAIHNINEIIEYVFSIYSTLLLNLSPRHPDLANYRKQIKLASAFTSYVPQLADVLTFIEGNITQIISSQVAAANESFETISSYLKNDTFRALYHDDIHSSMLNAHKMFNGLELNGLKTKESENVERIFNEYFSKYVVYLRFDFTESWDKIRFNLKYDSSILSDAYKRFHQIVKLSSDDNLVSGLVSLKNSVFSDLCNYRGNMISELENDSVEVTEISSNNILQYYKAIRSVLLNYDEILPAFYNDEQTTCPMQRTSESFAKLKEKFLERLNEKNREFGPKLEGLLEECDYENAAKLLTANAQVEKNRSYGRKKVTDHLTTLQKSIVDSSNKVFKSNSVSIDIDGFPKKFKCLKKASLSLMEFVDVSLQQSLSDEFFRNVANSLLTHTKRFANIDVILNIRDFKAISLRLQAMEQIISVLETAGLSKDDASTKEEEMRTLTQKKFDEIVEEFANEHFILTEYRKIEEIYISVKEILEGLPLFSSFWAKFLINVEKSCLDMIGNISDNKNKHSSLKLKQQLSSLNSALTSWSFPYNPDIRKKLHKCESEINSSEEDYEKNINKAHLEWKEEPQKFFSILRQGQEKRYTDITRRFYESVGNQLNELHTGLISQIQKYQSIDYYSLVPQLGFLLLCRDANTYTCDQKECFVIESNEALYSKMTKELVAKMKKDLKSTGSLSDRYNVLNFLSGNTQQLEISVGNGNDISLVPLLQKYIQNNLYEAQQDDVRKAIDSMILNSDQLLEKFTNAVKSWKQHSVTVTILQDLSHDQKVFDFLRNLVKEDSYLIGGTKLTDSQLVLFDSNAALKIIDIEFALLQISNYQQEIVKLAEYDPNNVNFDRKQLYNDLFQKLMSIHDFFVIISSQAKHLLENDKISAIHSEFTNALETLKNTFTEFSKNLIDIKNTIGSKTLKEGDIRKFEIIFDHFDIIQNYCPDVFKNWKETVTSVLDDVMKKIDTSVLSYVQVIKSLQDKIKQLRKQSRELKETDHLVRPDINKIAENLIFLDEFYNLHEKFESKIDDEIGKILQSNHEFTESDIYILGEELDKFDDKGSEIKNNRFKHVFASNFNNLRKKQTQTVDIKSALNSLSLTIKDEVVIEVLKEEFNTYQAKYKQLVEDHLYYSGGKEAYIQEQIVKPIKNFKINLPPKVSGNGVTWDSTTQRNALRLLPYLFALKTLRSHSASWEPHPVQVLSVLRVLLSTTTGYSNKFAFNIDNVETETLLNNHLLQIGTGEGKSVTLSILATVLAILGYDIRIVCYSNVLVERDSEEFQPLFDELSIPANQIKYDTFYSLVEGLIDGQNVREMISDYLEEGILPRQSSSKFYQTRPYILLIDEVDTFLKRAFFIESYHIITKLKNDPSIFKLLQFIWQESQKQNKPISYDAVISSVEYQACLDLLGHEWNFFMQFTVEEMLSSLSNIFDKSYKEYEFDKETYQIGYKIDDSINYQVSYNYETDFLYFKEFENQNLPMEELRKSLKVGLNIDSGSFLYFKFLSKFSAIIGVTGTLFSLTEDQKKLLVDRLSIQQLTQIPSAYGDRNGRFKFSPNDKMDVNIITSIETYHTNLFNEITRRIKDQRDASKNTRAVIVFFENLKSLQDFYSATKDLFRSDLRVHLLLEKLRTSERNKVIRKAVKSSTVTLTIGPSFGRGTDFFCYDENLDAAGGVHIIQTYFSMDVTEEVQIQGRTARSSNYGSYSMLLLQADLIKQFARLNTVNELKMEEIIKSGQIYDHLHNLRIQLIQTSSKNELIVSTVLERLHELSTKIQNGELQSTLKLFLQESIEMRLKYSTKRVIVVLDYSGSMLYEGNVQNGIKINSANKNLFIIFEQCMNQQDRFSILTFTNVVGNPVVPFLPKATNEVRIREKMTKLVSPAGGTAFYSAMLKAVEHVEADRDAHPNINSDYIIALTDGADEHSPTGEKEKLMTRLGTANIGVYIIGLGSDVKEDVLKAIVESSNSKDSGYRNAAVSEADISEAFKQIRKEIKSKASFHI